MTLKEVPQICEETGISWDYINEYSNKKLMFDSFGMVTLIEFLTAEPIKKYEEHFPSEEYIDIVNDKNRERVVKLDEIAEMVNKKAINPGEDLTEEIFKKAINEVNYLISNTDKNKPCPEYPRLSE